jgi:hypothetical protein
MALPVHGDGGGPGRSEARVLGAVDRLSRAEEACCSTSDEYIYHHTQVEIERQQLQYISIHQSFDTLFQASFHNQHARLTPRHRCRCSFE